MRRRSSSLVITRPGASSLEDSNSLSSSLNASDLITKHSIAKQKLATPKKSSSWSKNDILATVGRVKVGVRCRPPFQDEIDFAQGNFFPIVSCQAESPTLTNEPGRISSLARVSLTMLNGHKRDFVYDFAFDQVTSQDSVYDRIARPVVADVLEGYNGTIFAYGQTGTGKTYTMGILDFVDDKHAGIIPRALAQIFDYASEKRRNAVVTITLSFLQLYR